jgi:hypothetical protein
LNPARPTPRLLRRQRLILGRMGAMQPPAPARAAVIAEPEVPVETAPPDPADEVIEPSNEPPSEEVPDAPPPADQLPPEPTPPPAAPEQ